MGLLDLLTRDLRQLMQETVSQDSDGEAFEKE